MHLEKEEFEEIVYQKLELLPSEFRDRLENIEIFVDDGTGNGPFFGLYEGIPFPHRKNPGYSLVMPDKIILFQKEIERSCRTREQLEKKIERVLFHEIGHYFGMDEDELRRMKL